MYSKTQTDSLMAQREPLCITKHQYLKQQIIINHNGDLGISLELTSEFIGSVNTKADKLTSYSKSEVDNKFTIVMF